MTSGGHFWHHIIQPVTTHGDYLFSGEVLEGFFPVNFKKETSSLTPSLPDVVPNASTPIELTHYHISNCPKLSPTFLKDVYGFYLF